MAPRASVLEAELAARVRHLFEHDLDHLTVNTVRKYVEDKHGLEDGYFKSGRWKVKSKNIITETSVRALRSGYHPTGYCI